MTLHSKIAILDPTPGEELWRLSCRLLGADPDGLVARELAEHDTAKHEWWNKPGIGLNAWTWVQYAHDGPLAIETDWDEDTFEPTSTFPACVVVHFDTAYGYRADNGAGCSDLHAWLISAIGAWCETRGLRWRWYDEFQGTWHTPTDGHLAEFGNAERGAMPAGSTR